MALSGGLHAYFQEKDIEKKNLTEQIQDEKKKSANLMLICIMS